MQQRRIERRDQSVSNQLRRACFALAISYSLAPMAAEAATAADLSPVRHAPPDNVTLNLEPAIGQTVYTPYKALGRRYSDDSALAVLSHPTFQTDELNLLRAGVGMDFNLNTMGNLHFNLYSRDGDLDKGKRWTLGGANPALTPIICKKIWSLGGKLDLARTHPNGPRSVVVVPQLMFNLENLGGIGNKAQLTFQYQHWNNGSDYEDERPVPQLMVHWSF
jgi:hypothetical protein